ncbi:MAG: NAD(P)H-dependent oxidoreductase [Sphingobacterium sp.]|uniref:NAD(P)H-dependent oxidoreductase n=1 Tax=Sphingobacterium sp. JB170 TaxID=1434842 RepID=UPI00097EC0FA|nr:NAD(P)H-dependent oxidoreductase [Sphingobacterium sp. JB170]SJN48820.1 NAD(P)H oxidoreductase YRKL @ Flavodoxin 2 [Sphingobacterium sp. JB170]
MQTLVIVTHPNIENSIINKRWIQALESQPEKYKVHQLYSAYPDGKINISAEQQLIEQHEKIIFQFPLYWYSSPPLLKQWFDQVLTYGWAYGSNSGHKASGKKFALAISAGESADAFGPSGRLKNTLEELTRPFALSIAYIKGKFISPFAFYDLEFNTSALWVEKSVPEYLAYIDGL